MTIRRGPLAGDNFTLVPHHWSRNAALTMAEKGMLGYIASHAAGYDLTVQQIIAETADGERAIRSILTGLEQKGYLRLFRRRDAAGRLGSYDYELIPEPGQTAPNHPGDPQSGSDQAKGGVSAGGDQSADRSVDSLCREEQENINPPGGDAAAPPPEPDVKPETAQDVVAAWIDFCAGYEIKLPRQVIGRYAREIKLLLEQGYPPALIKHALKRMLDRGKASNPALLPAFAVEVQGKRPPESSGTPRSGYRSSAERNDDRRTKETEIARIADDLARQLGDNGTDPIRNLEIGRQARAIWASRQKDGDHSTGCQVTGYSEPDKGAGPDPVDAVWWETPKTPKEVTAS